MTTLVSERTTDRHSGSQLEVLRHWSSPEVILVASDIQDEDPLAFHAILQARLSHAKVLLVEVDEESSSAARTQHVRGRLSAGLAHGRQQSAERICNRLRSSGIPCEPVIVRGLRAGEIPAIARSCCADRVLVSGPISTPSERNGPCIAEQIIEGLDIPVCVVGRDLSSVSRYQRPSRRITLVLSSHGTRELPLAFSSHLAKQLHSQLTVMNIAPEGTRNDRDEGDRLASFTSHLSSVGLEDARQRCPIEMYIKQGEPVTEILNFDCRYKQDFFVLAPARNASPRDFGMPAVRAIIHLARCPVIVLAERQAPMLATH